LHAPTLVRIGQAQPDGKLGKIKGYNQPALADANRIAGSR
jgi:hypothetical protein